MGEYMKDVRLSSHGVYRTEYHIVWVTKYRRAILNSRAGQYLAELMPEVVEDLPGCEIVQCNIQPDHVHIAAPLNSPLSGKSSSPINSMTAFRALSM